MPTTTKTASKRPAKKRSTKRASATSSKKSKVTDDDSAVAAKKPRTKKKTSKSRSDAVSSDDDFGSGLIEEESPAKKATKKKRKVAKKTATRRKKPSDDGDEVVAEKKPAKKKRSPRKKKSDDFAAELDFDGPTSSDSDSGREASEEKPKSSSRRRRKPDNESDDDGGSREELSQSDRGDAEESGGSNQRSNNRRDGGSRASSGGDSSRDEQDGGGRRRRRRGRRGRGRRGGGEERAPQNKRGRGRDRGPSRDIEPVSTHVTGILEMHPKGYGFVRSVENDYAAQETDPFVSTAFIERFHLREGVKIAGEVGAGHRGQGPRLTTIDSIEGQEPDDFANVVHFDKLTPINPEEHIKLEMGPAPITTRVIDLLCPIGKGQRALIVAPPRSGKTILLQQMADAVAFNHPECHLMVMLIDERPEEVTEMRRHVKGDVIASSIDRDLENHVRVSQLVIERAKRLAEMGKDVFILLDSITRLARAFNKYTNTGRTGSGGIDVRAMDKPKKIFGSARVFDEGGSITVVGTALIQTGSRMDDVIFEEFKGTGNMELVLSRELADRRIWPAMDIEKSGTRREEKLLDPETLEGVTMMRRSLISLHPVEAMEQLVRTLSKFDTNKEFLSRIRSIM